MTTEEACDRLWASPTIDRESSAYAYSGRRPEWRTKVSRPIAAAADSMRATESNTGALHPVAMLMAMTGPSTSKSASAAKNSTTDSPRSKPAAVAKNSATVVISRPTPTPAPDLPPAYEDRYSLDPWRLKSRNVYKRRFRVEGKAVSWHYGLSDDNGHQPDSFFACRRQKSTWGFWVNFLCLRIVKELGSHRKEQGRNCHCDIEYIRTGKTRRDTSRLCVWVPGKTGRFVWTGMREHDKHCSCGAFNFSDSRAT